MATRYAFGKIVVFVGSAMLVPTSAALSADVDRGRGLYEGRCRECHSESVHGRVKRVARDFEEVRGWVKRWNKSLGLHWSEDDIDDVSVYLNSTYYRFSCPPQVCKVISLAPTTSGIYPSE